MAESKSTAAVAAKDPKSSADDDLPLTTARIVQLARAESEQVARSHAMQADFARRGEIIGVELPRLYFNMAQGIKEAVRRFNSGLGEDAPGPRLNYRETPGVTLREVLPGHDLLASVWRKNSRFDLILRFMSRTNRPDMPLIEGHGIFPQHDTDRVMLRIEGWVEGGVMTSWISINFRRRQIPVDELPERIVLALLKEESNFLFCDLNPQQPPAEEDLDD